MHYMQFHMVYAMVIHIRRASGMPHLTVDIQTNKAIQKKQKQSAAYRKTVRQTTGTGLYILFLPLSLSLSLLDCRQFYSANMPWNESRNQTKTRHGCCARPLNRHTFDLRACRTTSSIFAHIAVALWLFGSISTSLWFYFLLILQRLTLRVWWCRSWLVNPIISISNYILRTFVVCCSHTKPK